MKILVVSTPIFRLVPHSGLAGYGGLELIAWQCARGLAELGHEVAIVAPWGSVCPGVEVIPCGEERKVDEFGAYQAYWQQLPRFECVIDHSWMKFAYLLKQEGVFKGPVLGVMHAPVNTMYATLPPVDKPCMVCISEDQAEHFWAIHGWDCRVCYNGVDSETYKSLEIPRTDRFLFLARFSRIKGAMLAIEACRKAGVGLDLIGDVDHTGEPDYLRQCKEAADGEQIRIVGPASRGNCVWWYSQAHAFLHPVRDFREPFGLAPVEAMLGGLPVVAWDRGAMRETIPHGLTSFQRDAPGFLVRKEDELVDAIKGLADTTIRPEQRENLRKWASQFSVERMVKRYEQLAVEAVETGGW